MTSSWNGTFSRSGSTVSVSLPSWAQTLAPGGQYSQTGFCVQGPDRPTNVVARGGGSPPPPPTTTPPTTTPPPTTPPTTTAPPTTVPPAGGGLSATSTLDSQWDTGYCATVKVTNGSSRTLTPKSVSFTLNSQVTLTDAWNATVSRSGSQVTGVFADWAAPLAPGQSSTDLGFCTNRPAAAVNLPSGFSVQAR
jgi:cellulase/cellobiase CelA1